MANVSTPMANRNTALGVATHATVIGKCQTEELMSRRIYHKLTIKASSQLREIWLGDDCGHLVQMEVGELRTSLLPGFYVVSFGLKAPTYPIHLRKASRFTQSQLERGPTCPRPVPQLIPD
jgi:hypothetical protein